MSGDRDTLYQERYQSQYERYQVEREMHIDYFEEQFFKLTFRGRKKMLRRTIFKIRWALYWGKQTEHYPYEYDILQRAIELKGYCRDL